MHYGVYLSGVGDFCDPRLLAQLAYEAEAEGWDGVFIWDHVGHPSTAVDPWVALAAMATKTEHVKLGPVVTPLARRRPWKLARETVTLDLLSHGRLILGVGLGWSAREFEAFGEEVDSRVRAEKLDEGLEVLTGLWQGELFSYHGQYYEIHDACFLPRPVQVPRIPIWVCGTWSGKKAPFRRAARYDGVVAILPPSAARAISPNEVREVRAYVQNCRTADTGFDVVVILWSEGSRSSEELDEVSLYADAGVTWWLEDLSVERFSSVEEVRRRLHRGPLGQSVGESKGRKTRC